MHFHCWYEQVPTSTAVHWDCVIWFCECACSANIAATWNVVEYARSSLHHGLPDLCNDLWRVLCPPLEALLNWLDRNAQRLFLRGVAQLGIQRHVCKTCTLMCNTKTLFIASLCSTMLHPCVDASSWHGHLMVTCHNAHCVRSVAASVMFKAENDTS